MNRTDKFCVIDVVCHPHPEGIYRQLFETAAGKGVPFWGDLFAAITPISTTDDDGVFTGSIAIWTQVDKNSDVIDLKEFKEVSLTESTVIIPDNIGLNSKVFMFAFRIRDHKLFVHLRNDAGKTISAGRLEMAFSKIFARDTESAAEVYVTLVPEKESVERVLALPELRRVEMKIRRPNPDSLDDEMNNVLEELEKQGAKSQEIDLIKSPDAASLILSAKNMIYARVAAYTGYLRTFGRNETDEKVELSTRDHPRMLVAEVSSDASPLAVLKNVAKGE